MKSNTYGNDRWRQEAEVPHGFRVFASPTVSVGPINLLTPEFVGIGDTRREEGRAKWGHVSLH
jgi:hypothetical protein